MPDKRRSPRIRKRLRIIFVDAGQEHVGISTNLSRTGLCVTSSYVVPAGSRIQGRFALPNGVELQFDAEVRWSRRARAGLSAVESQSAMGLRFLAAIGVEFDAFIEQQIRSAPVARGSGSFPVATAPTSPTQIPQVRPGAVSLTPTPRPETTAQPGFGKLIPGLEGRVAVMVGPDDFAAPADRYGCAFSPTRASHWIEQAAQKAVAVQLPPGGMTIGVSMRITISHAPPVALGTRVTALARLVEVAPVGRTLKFEVKIDDGVRDICSGEHVRAIAEPRKLGR